MENDMQSYAFQFTKQDLVTGINDGCIQHYYQSVVDLHTLDVVGFETLVRWQHPTMGLLTSAHFVFEMSREGLIPALTQMAIKHAAKFYHAARDQGLKPVPVSINVTAAELEAPSWYDNLQNLVSELGLPPAFLTIEILEWGKANDLEKVGQVAIKLKAAGFLLVADDFGEAYGTFFRMLSIPFDGIKIASDFTKALDQKREAKAILECLIDLSQKLGMSFVVEGVETESQAQALVALGIKTAQGYLFHRPSPLAGALQQLRCAAVLT